MAYQPDWLAKQTTPIEDNARDCLDGGMGTSPQIDHQEEPECSDFDHIPPEEVRVRSMDDLYKMSLLEVRLAPPWKITAVPSGWIFENMYRCVPPVFVPGLPYSS